MSPRLCKISILISFLHHMFLVSQGNSVANDSGSGRQIGPRSFQGNLLNADCIIPLLSLGPFNPDFQDCSYSQWMCCCWHLCRYSLFLLLPNLMLHWDLACCFLPQIECISFSVWRKIDRKMRLCLQKRKQQQHSQQFLSPQDQIAIQQRLKCKSLYGYWIILWPLNRGGHLTEIKI